MTKAAWMELSVQSLAVSNEEPKLKRCERDSLSLDSVFGVSESAIPRLILQWLSPSQIYKFVQVCKWLFLVTVTSDTDK